MLRRTPPDARNKKLQQFPYKVDSRQQLEAAIQNLTLGPFMPQAPFITRQTKLVTLGSCFAQNIARYLSKKGYPVQPLNVNERLFNAFSVRDFIRGVADKKDVDGFSEEWKVEPAQIEGARNALLGGATAIVTFGLSFVWHDLETDEMIPDPTKKDGVALIVKNPERYEMRATTPDANAEAMLEMINALRKINPFTKIILTLSPVHMARAVCDYPVIAADAISKSTLRVALHQITDLRLKDVFYFPSFEILKWFVPMTDLIWFEDNLLSHVQRKWTDYVMSKFAEEYCIGETATAAPTRLPDAPA